MTRRTSADTYLQIHKDGTLSRLRLEVYETLYARGPLTAAELDEILKDARGSRGGYWKRLPELRDMGVVAEIGTRKCAVTGRQAVVWQTTDNLPTEIRSKPANHGVRVYLSPEDCELLLRREVTDTAGAAVARGYAEYRKKHPNTGAPSTTKIKRSVVRA